MRVPGPIGSPGLSVCENATLVVDLLHFVCVNSFLFQAFFFSFWGSKYEKLYLYELVLGNPTLTEKKWKASGQSGRGGWWGSC